MNYSKRLLNRLFSLNNLVFLCFGAVVFVILADRITDQSFAISDYSLSEWLINYSTGFVRRGLSGSILLWLHENWHLSIDRSITAGSYFIFLATAAYYVQRVFRLRYALPFHVLVIILFLPSSILLPILDQWVMGNKDFLFIMLLILHILIINRYTRDLFLNREEREAKAILARYAIAVAIVYNLTGIFLALMHEGILLLSIPVNSALSFLIFLHGYTAWRSAAMSILVYSPTILVSLAIVLSLFFSAAVDEQRALDMCLPFDFMERINCATWIPGAMQALMLSHTDAYLNVYNRNVHSNVVFTTWVTLILANIFLAAYAGIRCAAVRLQLRYGAAPLFPVGDAIRSHVIFTLLAPLGASLPLFLVTVDWGRWVFLTNASFLICSIASNHIFLHAAQWRSLSLYSRGFDRQRAAVLKRRRSKLSRGFLGCVMLLAFYLLSSTTLPHCCIRQDEVAGRVLTNGVIDQFVDSGYNLFVHVMRRLGSSFPPKSSR